MRIFWFNTETNEDPLTLVYSDTPSRELLFPSEIIKKIIDYLPRSSLPFIAPVSKIWYATVMPILYKHIYIRTLPHWIKFISTVNNHHFQFGNSINSIVLKPSPKLISGQLTSYLSTSVVINDDILQPNTRGYVRLERVDYNLTGLEGIEVPMSSFNDEEENEQQQQQHENYIEMDDTKKEYEWLTLVTTEQVVSVLKYCPMLEYLNLSGCENLNDDILIQLSNTKRNDKYSKPMKGIWINLLRNLTPKGIESLLLFEKSRFSNTSLNHLDIGYNINLDSNCLLKVINYWGNSLTHLRLDTIYQVNDETINCISKNCFNLRLLHITRCWNITNNSITVLSNGCKKLRYISLAFLSQVNEIGIRSLVHHLTELQWLNITGCGINPLFKPIILENFANYRREHALIPIHMQDGSVNLI